MLVCSGWLAGRLTPPSFTPSTRSSGPLHRARRRQQAHGPVRLPLHRRLRHGYVPTYVSKQASRVLIYVTDIRPWVYVTYTHDVHTHTSMFTSTTPSNSTNTRALRRRPPRARRGGALGGDDGLGLAALHALRALDLLHLPVLVGHGLLGGAYVRLSVCICYNVIVGTDPSTAKPKQNHGLTNRTTPNNTNPHQNRCTPSSAPSSWG